MGTAIDNRYIWLGGEIVPLSEAKINVLAPSSQFGANVFEGIRCYWNEEEKQLYAFRLEEHYKRLQESARIFHIPIKYSVSELGEYLKAVVRANDYHEDIAVRQTLFIDGFGSWSSTEPINMFIAPIPKQRNDLKQVSGLKCGISSWQRISDRNMSPRVKVGANYINSRMAQLEAKEHGYDTPIFMNELGKIAEGPGSCLFVIKDGKLLTSSLTSSILDSITRRTIIELAKEELQIQVEERDIERTELYVADEAFLCGSAMEVRSISSIDGYRFDEAHRLTEQIHKIYLQVVCGKLSKYKGWLEAIYE